MLSSGRWSVLDTCRKMPECCPFRHLPATTPSSESKEAILQLQLFYPILVQIVTCPVRGWADSLMMWRKPLDLSSGVPSFPAVPTNPARPAVLRADSRQSPEGRPASFPDHQGITFTLLSSKEQQA